MQEPKPKKCPECGKWLTWFANVRAVGKRVWLEGEKIWDEIAVGHQEDEADRGPTRLRCTECGIDYYAHGDALWVPQK